MTKDELREYVKLKIELKSIEEQYEELKTEIESPKISIVNDMSRGGKGFDFTDKVEKLIDLQKKYYNIRNDTIRKCAEIENAIETLSDPTERSLMRYKYINGLTWEEVCVKINYGWERTHHYHKSALIKLKTV